MHNFSKENFVEVAANSVLFENETHVKVKPGITGYISELVQNGSIAIKTNDLFKAMILKEHFEKYHFVTCRTEKEKEQTVFVFSFDREEFLKSNLLRKYAEEFATEFRKEAKKLDQRANELRIQAKKIEKQFLGIEEIWIES